MFLSRFRPRRHTTPERALLRVMFGGSVIAECYVYGIDLPYEKVLDMQVATVVQWGQGPGATGVYFVREGVDNGT